MVTNPLQLVQGTPLPHDIHPGFPPDTTSPGQPSANAPGLKEISAQWVEIHKRLEHITQKQIHLGNWEQGKCRDGAPYFIYQTNIVVSAIISFHASNQSMK